MPHSSSNIADTSHHRLAVHLSWVAATLVGSLGLAAQVGALTGIHQFASIVPNGPQMAVSTGRCFFVAAVAILLLHVVNRHPERFSNHAWAARCAGLGLLITGVSVVGRYVLGEPAVPTGNAGQVSVMAPATALNFVLFGGAILSASKQSIRAFQSLCLMGMLIGWLGTIRYLTGGEPLSLWFAMSLNSSLAFVALALGLLATQPSHGIMALLLARTDGGRMVRCMLPFILVVPPTLGFIRLNGEREGWYSPEGGLALNATLNVAVLSLLTWFYARRLHLADQERTRQTTLANHLSQVVQSSEDAIISKNLDGIILSWNNGAERLYGYSSAEAIGMSIQQLMLPNEQEQEEEIKRTIIAGGSVQLRDGIRLHKSGLRLDVTLSISPIHDAQGAIVGVANISRDIGERIRSAARIQANLARLDLLRQVTQSVGEHHDLASIYQVVVGYLEKNMPVDFAAVCLYDRNSHSLEAAYLSAGSVAFLQGQPAKERLSFAIADNGLAKCIDGALVYESDLTTHNGPLPRRLVAFGMRSLVAAPMRVESLVQGVILVARTAAGGFSSGECEFLQQLGAHVALATRHAEIHTALESAYNDLRQTQQAAIQHERLRALGQMASGITHDINNALSPVILYAERILAKETNLSERGRNDLRTILRAGEDIAATVGRLREFYRQQGSVGKMAGADLNQVMTQVIELTKTQWQDAANQRGITIHVHHEFATDLPFVLSVENELREALTNLTLNALDAMPTGGTLTFRTRCIETPGNSDGSPGNRAVQIDVADTGVGMDEHVRLRCLEPFFTTKGERGTGLGLAMVYGIIQRHGGELAIDSAPGRGTTFTLTFYNLTLSRTPTVLEMSSAPRRLRMLLVDDDPIIIKALSDSLLDDGHDLVLTSGGQAGITAFLASLGTSAPFDVVITDLGMPQVDGRRVAQAVKAASPATPVLMLTGWGQRLNDDEQLPANVDLVLSKPPRMHEIRSALHRLCPG